MRIRKVEASLDRRIITGMIVSDKFLQMILPIYHSSLLTAPFAIQVAGWCVEHYKKYKKAPNKHIQDIFYAKQDGMDDAQIEIIETFLSGLSEEYTRSEKFNVEYLYDQSEQLFRTRKLKMLSEDIDAHLSRGELDLAETKWAQFHKLERPKANGIEPLNDQEAFKHAFLSVEEPLFHLPGALGSIMNPHFVREGFVALLGRAKIGKTWTLKLIAQAALKEQCNVAFFQMGDLSQNNFMVRLGVMLSKKSNDPRYCGEVFVPMLDCIKNQFGACEEGTTPVRTETGLIENWKDHVGKHKPCCRCQKDDPKFKGAPWYHVRPKCEPLGWREAWKKTKEWKKRHRAKQFKLSTYSTGSCNSEGILQQLDMWEDQEGFVPDVIMIDYADIMGPEKMEVGKGEYRHSENERWKALRRMAQDRKALVITVTQANRGGVNEESLSIEHTSEDKRKYDHCTAFFALNQTPDEKQQKITRVGELLTREGAFNVNKQAAVLQCLEMGQPLLTSYWWEKEKKRKGEKE